VPHIKTQYHFAPKLYSQDWPEIASHINFKIVLGEDPQTPRIALELDPSLQKYLGSAPGLLRFETPIYLVVHVDKQIDSAFQSPRPCAVQIE
jgi:hypothetical protein